jgi:hypothetical protein
MKRRFHAGSRSYSGLYYRIGELDPVSGTVTWGPKGQQFQSPSTYGRFPSVAISKEGYDLSFSSGDYHQPGLRRKKMIQSKDLSTRNRKVS